VGGGTFLKKGAKRVWGATQVRLGKGEGIRSRRSWAVGDGNREERGNSESLKGEITIRKHHKNTRGKIGKKKV